MDLREKPTKLQIVSEFCIRFRLPLLVVWALLWIFACAPWSQSTETLLEVSARSTEAVRRLLSGDFAQASPVAGFAALLLFVVRFWLFGLWQGFLWLAALLLFVLFFASVATLGAYEYLVVGAVLALAVTLLVFARPLWAKAFLPWLLLAYTFSAWLFSLGAQPLCYGGMASLFMADSMAYLLEAQRAAQAKKPLAGALVAATRKVFPVMLCSVAFLMALDAVLFAAGAPALGSATIAQSLALHASYLLWMPLFSTALYSLCPLVRGRG